MHRKFIALITGLAMAITSVSAAPAQADTDDMRRVIAGLAALAIIGAAINLNKNDQAVTHAPDPYVRKPQPRYKPQPNYNRHQPRYNRVQPQNVRPQPQRLSRYNLPAECLANFTVNRTTKRLFGARCLTNKYRFAQSLPYACQYQFRTAGVTRTTYEPVCLRERGYRVAGK
ncbi:MAG: hypothetical protein AB8B51_00365 [Sedimentitalea sp.]